MKEIIEMAAHEARRSEFVEQKIRRERKTHYFSNGKPREQCRKKINNKRRENIFPRITDLGAALPGMTGKIELVFEGEQEGPVKVSRALIGKCKRGIPEIFPRPAAEKT